MVEELVALEWKEREGKGGERVGIERGKGIEREGREERGGGRREKGGIEAEEREINGGE